MKPCLLVLPFVAALVFLPPCVALAGDAPSGGKTIKQYIADLSNPDPVTRSKATMALGNMGAAAVDAISELADTLRDRDSNVRGNAAWALGAIGWNDDVSTKALARALSDPAPGVRGRAVVALRKIGVDSPEILAAIKSMAENDKDEKVRRSARDTVAALSPSDADKMEYKPAEPETGSSSKKLDDYPILTTIPDDLTDYLGLLRKHNGNLAVIGLKVASIDEDPKPATKQLARKWAEDTRAVGREMVAESKAYADTLHRFVYAKTRKGLPEEVALVQENSELVYECIGQYKRVADVDKRDLKRKIIEDVIVKEARDYFVSRSKKRIAQKLDNAGLREILDAKSWNEALDKTLVIFQKGAEREIEAATEKAFGLPFHDEGSLKVALRQRFHDVLEKGVAKVIVRLVANGIVVNVGAHEAVQWLEKNLWPHLREALREKGDFDIRVPRSLGTLNEARMVLFRLPNNAEIPTVLRAMDVAKGKLVATRYLEKDMRDAWKPELTGSMKDLYEAQLSVEQLMDITRQRFMLDKREAVEKLGNSEGELRMLIWVAGRMVESVKEPPVKEEQKTTTKVEDETLKAPKETSKPAPAKPATKFAGMSFQTTQLRTEYFSADTTLQGTVSVNLSSNGIASGSFSATQVYKPKGGLGSSKRYEGHFHGAFDIVKAETTAWSVNVIGKMTITIEGNKPKERECQVQIDLPLKGMKPFYANDLPLSGSISSADGRILFQYDKPKIK